MSQNKSAKFSVISDLTARKKPDCLETKCADVFKPREATPSAIATLIHRHLCTNEAVAEARKHTSDPKRSLESAMSKWLTCASSRCPHLHCPCEVRRCRPRRWLRALLPPFCNLFLGLLLSDFSLYIFCTLPVPPVASLDILSGSPLRCCVLFGWLIGFPDEQWSKKKVRLATPLALSHPVTVERKKLDYFPSLCRNLTSSPLAL